MGFSDVLQHIESCFCFSSTGTLFHLLVYNTTKVCKSFKIFSSRFFQDSLVYFSCIVLYTLIFFLDGCCLTFLFTLRSHLFLVSFRLSSLILYLRSLTATFAVFPAVHMILMSYASMIVVEKR